MPIKRTNFQQKVTPPPVSIEKLRRYFSKAYGLKDAQVEVLVESSAKSINQAFANISAAMDSKESAQQLALFLHGLKGVFLNMGENEWALFVKQLEQEVETILRCDFEAIVVEMQGRLENLLSYPGAAGQNSEG